MLRTALTMLVGDRGKFLGIVFGLAFATLLMTQQGAIFRGVMTLAFGHVTDTPQAGLWISDPGMPDMDTTMMLNERELDGVRSVAAVRWAVPLCRRLLLTPVEGGTITPMMAMGIDDATLIGGPQPGAMLDGSVEDLRRPGTMIVDAHGAATKLRIPTPGGGSRPARIGDLVVISGRSIEIVGICRSTMALMLYPTLYMRRSLVSALDPADGGGFNFILAGTAPGADPAEACRAVQAATGLSARTSREFSDHIYDFYLYNTGIPANFAIAVLLGFVVGAAIVGQTFHQYVSDNRRIFASLKAMGMRDRVLAGILVWQGAVAAVLGYGLGVGAAAAFGWALQGTDLGFRLEPILLAMVFAAVMAIAMGAALLSLRSVVRLDPALVFRS